MIQRLKKFTVGVMVALVAFTSLAGTLLVAEPARAGLPVAVDINLPEQLKDVLLQVWEFLKTAILNAAVRLVSYAIRKVAYDSAVWLASGGKGQSPFAHTKDFGSYMGDIGNEAFGAAIESLADPRTGIGINLCKIPDIKIDLAMKVGLRLPGFGGFGQGQASQKPSCSFTEFTTNWGNGDAWKSRFNAAGNSIEQQFNSAMSSADQTDFGIYLGAKKYIDTSVVNKIAGEQFQRLEGQGYQAKQTLVSNQITTPAGTMKKELEHNTPSTQQEKDEQQIAALLSSGDVKVLPTILGIFINTLASTMVKNYQEKGILPFGIGASGSSQQAALYESGAVLGGRRQAQEYFSSILQTAKIRTVEDYNLSGQLSSCPDSPTTYNCRADENLVQALKQTESGEPVTIAQALKQDRLHGKWKLIPPGRLAENMDKNCYHKAYCYGDVKVLRQARILPLGFEIAAKLSDPDRPWTLEQVVNGFYDCGAQYDPVNKPFCHLIDPNWVIKLPATKCRAVVWGETPVSGDVPYRNEQCADLTSCVGYDNRGNCTNYGYCTREKNAWDFAADTCDAQFSTCRTYLSANGQSASYLYRTLNTGFCAENNVGCNFYSLTQDKRGTWQGPGQDAAQNNTGIYFNNKVSASCSANSAGCNAFAFASSTNVTLYLRQAPDYLGCYDSDPVAPGAQRPENTAELNRLPESASCQGFAQACIKDEVGCNLYTPTSGDPRAVPGKYTADNICAPQCVGYDSYREMPSHYSNGQPLAYIIPSSGAACSSKDAGCTGFTSLKDISAGGAEQVEYFSYLRPCVLPAQSPGKNFFTYEGSLTGGFQLQTYRLVANTAPEDLDPANLNNELGAPKYFYRTPEDKKTFADECNKTRYTEPGSNLDCRQFNNDQGLVYYRLLSKTIPVTSACTPYRLNDTELYTAPSINDPAICANDYKGFWDPANKECKLCFQNGEYRDGQCFYNGLPGASSNSAGTSHACEQSANSCREYKGNAGNNIKVVVDNTFEETSSTVAQANWAGTQGPFSIATESTHVGGHSLGYTGAGTLFKSLTLAPGESYDLTFWAKGTGAATAVSLVSADNKFKKDFGAVSPGDTWNLYHLGPIELSDQNNLIATTSFWLSWAMANRGSIFLDNVRLVQVAEDLYLVKNSLRVDGACDSTPEDNLPGEALGCQAYKDPAGVTVNLTGFSFLCREKAIGCTPVYDTRNTPAEIGPHIYNVLLTGNSGSLVVLDVGFQNQNPKCQIPTGQSGCYVNAPSGVSAAEIVAAGGFLVTSTIAIPADTSPDAPLYLVADKAATCNQADLGCALAGRMQSGPLGATFVTTTIKNDPAAYSDQLCIAEAVGCSAYTDTSGGNAYFKDPVINGQKICEYKPEVDVKGAKYSGWFWKGVGVCATDAKKLCAAGSDCALPKVCGKKQNQACVSNNDCGAGDTCVDSCQSIGNQACYPAYLQNGSFGLWSYGDTPRYDNFVGVCPAEQDQCTEFVDHNDNDTANHLIKNSKISAGDCSGLVSQKAGCALFDQTDNPNKYWSTKGSYDKSDAVDGRLVEPFTNPSKNDANILIKVKPDRACGEWLQCRSSHVVKDQKTGAFKTVCDDIGRCNKTPETAEKGDTSGCANWVVEPTIYTNTPLTEDLYVGRDVTWKGADFSGWSLLNLYPLDELRQINTNFITGTPAWRLIRPVPCGGTKSPDPTVCVNQSPASLSTACIPAADDPHCGEGGEFNIPCKQLATCGTKAQPGVCLHSRICAETPAGANDGQLPNVAPSQICRAYPEQDAPFPNTPTVIKALAQFKGANRCNEGSTPSSLQSVGYACECDYTRAQYGDILTKFWNYARPNSVSVIGPTPGRAPAGICQGGDRNGLDCEKDNDCHRVINPAGKVDKDNIQVFDKDSLPITDGSCQLLKRSDPWLGWRGYCVEPDLSRPLNGNPEDHPCLTWYPVDSLNGASDINNQHTEAGFNNPPAYYCLAARGNGGNGPWNPRNPRNYYSWLTRNSDQGTGFYFGSKFAPPDDPVYGAFSGAPFDNGQFARQRFGLTAQEPSFYQYDIEKITLTVRWGDTKDPNAPTEFEIWPNDLVTGKPQASYSLKYQGGDSGTAVTGRYLEKDNEFVLWYGDKDGQYITSEGNICTNCGDNLGGNIFKDLTKDGQTLGEDGIWNTSKTSWDFCPVDKGHGGNWHAIRFHFDPATRQFLWYDTAYCDDSDDSGAIDYDIKFQLREWCQNVADVTMNYADQNHLVAWTDRLWNLSKSYLGHSALKIPFNDQTKTGPPYKYATRHTAFGSLDLASPPTDPLIITQFLPPAKNPQQQWICPPRGPNDKPESSCSYNVGVQDYVVGAPYSCGDRLGGCIGYDPDDNTPAPTNAGQFSFSLDAASAALQNLGELFSKVISYFEFAGAKGPGQYTYSAKNDLPLNFTKNGLGKSLPVPPFVHPLGVCNSQNQCLEEPTDGFSINGTSTDNVYLFSANKRVTARFFTAANANQMPIREVKLDWGDDTAPSAPGQGEYRNQRGLAQSVCHNGACEVHKNNDPSDTLIDPLTDEQNKPLFACKVTRDCPQTTQCVAEQKAANFGLIVDTTCDNAYLQFDHDYQCVAGQANNWFPNAAKCGKSELYPKGCCVYTPGVQVKDNWGWCAGNCKGAGTGCYDGNDGSNNDCQTTPNSWVPFGGQVIVAPSF